MTHRITLASLGALCASSALAATPGVVTGSFAKGEAYAPPAEAAPAQASRYHVQLVELSGGSGSVEIAGSGKGSLLVWTLAAGAGDGSAITSTLRTPAGRVLEAGQNRAAGDTLRRFAFAAGEVGLDLPADQQVIDVQGAEAGTYRVDVQGSAKAVLVVAAEPESDLVLSGQAGPLSRRADQPVQLRVELREGQQPLAGRVTARLAAPGQAAGQPIELLDDGRHGDGGAADGVFGASLDSLPSKTSGLWTVRYEAEGRTADGQRFQRSGSAGFVNEPALASLRSAAARIVKGALRVDAEVIAATAGDYRLDVIVAGPAGRDGSRPGIAWGEATRRLAPGKNVLALDVPLEGASGPYLVDVRLLGLGPMGVAGRTVLEVAP